jgi:hypothetical protein
MSRKLLSALVLGLVLINAAAAQADGDIYVGGPWGTKITSLPYEIKTPGSYYLGGNLSFFGAGDGITIAAGVNHVTLDLMGFTINGNGYPNWGIVLNGSKNVEIRNGTVTGWGFGIVEEGYNGRLHRIINVRVVGNSRGIFLRGQGHMVKGCEVTATEGNTAIDLNPAVGTVVSGCTVKLENGYGINSTGGGIFNDNVVIGTGAISPRYGIYAQGTGTLIKGNQVSGCKTGIFGSSGKSVIGNTVDTASLTTGFSLTDEYSTLLDQNTVLGPGTPYNPSNFSNAARRNNYPEASSP